MALKLGSLYYDIGADTSALRSAEGVVAGTTRRMGRSFLALGSIIAAAFSVKEVISMADNMTMLRARVRNLTSSQREFNKVFAELERISNRIGTSIDSNVSSFQRFAMSKEVLKANNAELLKFSETIQKLGIISGATGQEVAATSIQIGQALSNNFEAAAQEINSINEQMPAVARAVEDSLGLIPGSFKKAVSEGLVTSRQFFDAILLQSDKTDERFSKLPVTIDRAWQVFMNKLSVNIGKINESTQATQGIADAIIDAANGLDKHLIPAFVNLREVILRARDSYEGTFDNTAGEASNIEKFGARLAAVVGKITSGFMDMVYELPTLISTRFSLLEQSLDRFVINAVAGFNVLKEYATSIVSSEEGVDERVSNIRMMRDEAISASEAVSKATLEHHWAEIARLKELSEARRAAALAGSGGEGGSDAPLMIDIPLPLKQGEAMPLTGGETTKKPKFDGMDIGAADAFLSAIDSETAQIVQSYKERHNEIIAMEDANAREKEALMLANEKRLSKNLQAVQLMRHLTGVSAMQQFGDQVMQLLEASGKEQSAMGKALFLANKTLAVATIILNAELGASQALGMGPFGIPLSTSIRAMGYASAGIAAGLAINNTFKGGGRQSGGQVFPNAMHPVNEDGAPEMLVQGSRQYLLPGAKGGRVISGNDMIMKGGGAPKVTVINNGSPIDVRSTSITRDEVVIMVDNAERNAVNRVNTSLASGRGSTFNSMRQASKVQRNIR